MAAEGPVKELWKEASCSICLDFFRDPVILTECGHNFCRACLTRSWRKSGTAGPSCPQCRGTAQLKRLRPNQQLANFVEIAKRFRPLEGEGAEAKGGVCEKHQEPLKFFCKEDEAPLCVVCGLSQEHKDHEVVPLEEAFQENKAVVAARKGRICQKHEEPLKLFCKDDEALICVVCDRSKEHRDHETLPLKEASEEYKKQTTGEKQETVAKFRQLHTFLEEQEKLLLAQMEEVEKEVAKNRDQLLARLSEELSSLESLIREMEEKSQQPAGDLLQDVRSTLQRYEEKERFENPVTFPLALKWWIWDFCDINLSLEGVMKQLKDNLDSGLHLQKANVTLDLDTAHPELILSEDQKSVRLGKNFQALPNSPERFDEYSYVLGRAGFTAGRHFWEVLVGSEEEWTVGVARRSVDRKGEVSFDPEGGFWEVGRYDGCYNASIDDGTLTVSGELKRIRVCLNYPGGRVAFFDGDRAALLYEFSGASFSGETLLPSFWVNLKGHLQLC
ncbi:PREDICTED: tripartite motif-containing protein 7-like [Gekko japonicus]|uniref:Tripartite motif-containing protein 7-like n=1 Tax=Gekko japonicus TaxID=146911 RepID=A0ABM1JX84_GEKJA|nr:PREDICTED: tripartite motif-containing protein 7-like [Gekko japonicus]